MKLDELAKKIGKAVEDSKPYWEARRVARQVGQPGGALPANPSCMRGHLLVSVSPTEGEKHLPHGKRSGLCPRMAAFDQPSYTLPRQLHPARDAINRV